MKAPNSEIMEELEHLLTKAQDAAEDLKTAIVRQAAIAEVTPASLRAVIKARVAGKTQAAKDAADEISDLIGTVEAPF